MHLFKINIISSELCITKVAIYSVTLTASRDFWRDFAGKGVLTTEVV